MRPQKSSQQLAELERPLAAHRSQPASRIGFRAFCESPDYLGLELSLLVARIADESDAGGARTVAISAGLRGGKTSRLLAPKALHAAWTVPLPTVSPGEFASSLIIGPDLKLARQALSFAAGYALASPVLSAALMGEPTKDAIELRRPDGRQVRVEVLAASARGRATRGRTLVFAGLDEACFFRDESTGVVNDTEIYDSVLGRLVPGAQVWVVSTPWVAEVGLLERLMSEPGRALAYRASTRELNPTWDPDGSIERDMRADDPEKARREIDAIPLSSSAVTFFEPETISRAINPALAIPRTARPGEKVGAGGDFGFRSDGSAIAVVHQDHKTIRLGDLLERRPGGGVALKPSDTIREFAARLLTHAGLTHLVADAHYQETVTEYLGEVGLGYVPAPLEVAETYIRARALMREGRVEIPNHPRLIAQLRSVQWRPNPGGSISIVLPRERTGGHCDLVSAFVLALWQAASVEVEAPPPPVNSPEYFAAQEAAMLARMEQRLQDRLTDAHYDRWAERDD